MTEPSRELQSALLKRSFTPQFASGGGVGGTIGGVIGSVIPGVGTVIGAVAGSFLGSLFGGGGGQATPTLTQTFVDTLRQYFPDQNAPVCGTPVPVDFLNAGAPAFLNIPCSDPTLGGLTRSGIEWWISQVGLGIVAKNLGNFFTAPQTQQQSAASPNVNVVVNNLETIGDTVISSLADAVNKGITATTDQLEQFQTSLFGKIGDVLSSIGSSIWNGIKDALSALGSKIGDIVKGIVDNLPSILKAVLNEIGKLVNDLRGVLVDILNKVGPVLDSIAKEVQNINDHLIQPLANLYNTTIKTIADLTIAIQKDLHDGLSGILKIPTDIANGLTSLDATMTRTVQQLGQTNSKVWTDILYDENTKKVGVSLSGVAGSLAGAFGTKTNTTFRPSSETLTDPTLANSLPTIITALNSIASDLVKGVWKTLQDPAKAGELLVSVSAGILAEVFEPFEIVLFLWEVMKAPLEIMGELAAEKVRTLVPLEKLPAVNVVEAWKRSFLSAEQMDEELLLQGISKDRSKLLRDLSQYVEQANTLADYAFRGIISDTDFTGGLHALGFTDPQIAAFREGNYRILEPTTAQEAYRRGIIDEDALKIVLAVNRYTADQQTLLTDLAFRPSTSDEALQGIANRTALGQFTIGSSDFDNPPQWFSDAAKTEGLDDNAIRNKWWAHWNVGTLQTWIQLYFRGIRTLSELQNMLDRYFIPRELHQDFIDSLRPLIPYRSLPSFVKAGYLTDSDARKELASHGFDLHHINIIMSAATATTSKTAAATTQQTKQLSLQNARTLFEDGVLTLEEYSAILEAHGYSAELAAAQAQVDQVAAQTKQRKQALSDLQAQVEVGQTTIDDAVQLLTQNGYTQAEIARFQKTVARYTKAAEKHPSVANLKAFYKAQIITADQFKQELQSQGWADIWVSAFLALDTVQTPASSTGG